MHLSFLLVTFAASILVLVLFTTATSVIEARIATDVSYGDTLPLFASFRLGTTVKTHRRPMARKYHPVVGVHRVLTVPNFHVLASDDAKEAAESLIDEDAKKKSVATGDDGIDVDETGVVAKNAVKKETVEEVLAKAEGLYNARHVSAMFHVGRMGARTPWMSVIRHPIQRASPESQVKSSFLGGGFLRGRRETLTAADKQIPNKDEYLEEVQIFFDTVPSPEGLPTSSVTKMTFNARYSPKPVNLTLEYVWREQKAYSPEFAISVAGVIAIVCVSVLSVVMFSGRDALKRELVVKIRDE